jgi:hypothetical protein
MICEICKQFTFIEEIAFINKEPHCTECNLEVDRQFAKEFTLSK